MASTDESSVVPAATRLEERSTEFSLSRWWSSRKRGEHEQGQELQRFGISSAPEEDDDVQNGL